MKNSPRSYARRRSVRPEQNPRKRRLIAVLATLGVFGALVAVTQVSLADTRGKRARAVPCPPATATASPGGAATASPTRAGTPTPGAGDGSGAPAADASAAPGDNAANGSAAAGSTEPPAAADGASPVPTNGVNPSGAPYRESGSVQHPGDGQQPGPAPSGTGTCTPSSPAPGGSGNPGGGLDVLADTCDESRLPEHDGFQLGDRCVDTEFGEVSSAENNPSLLITSAPRDVARNRPFTLRVSTRNLVRDRFLPAGQGGYYKESSLLAENGLVRGHFHTACRMLTSGRTAPDPAPVPAFFVATEDGKGNATPDTVRVTIPGLAQRGTAQCAVWAGDGSHRIPMMMRANQIPAFDVVRIQVR